MYGVSGNCSLMVFALRSSTSQRATIFALFEAKLLLKFPAPLPPIPIAAIPNLSLGATYPRPRTCLGTIKNAAEPAKDFLRNFLLVVISKMYLNNIFKYNDYIHAFQITSSGVGALIIILFFDTG